MDVTISFLTGGVVCALTTHLTRNYSVDASAVFWSFPLTLIVSLVLSGEEKVSKMLLQCSKTSVLTFVLLNVVAICNARYQNIFMASWFGLMVWITLSLLFFIS